MAERKRARRDQSRRQGRGRSAAFVLRQVRVVRLDQCRAAEWRFRLPGSRREYRPGRYRGVIWGGRRSGVAAWAVVGSPYEQAPRRADIFAVLCHGESPPLPSAHPDDLTYGVRVLTVIPRSVMEGRIKLELPGHRWPQRAPTPSTAVVPFVRFGPRKRTCAPSKSSHREKPRSRYLSSGITSRTPCNHEFPPRNRRSSKFE